MRIKRTLLHMLAVLTSAALVACGGGGGSSYSPPATTTPVAIAPTISAQPASASA